MMIQDCHLLLIGVKFPYELQYTQVSVYFEAPLFTNGKQCVALSSDEPQDKIKVMIGSNDNVVNI